MLLGSVHELMLICGHEGRPNGKALEFAVEQIVKIRWKLQKCVLERYGKVWQWVEEARRVCQLVKKQ